MQSDPLGSGSSGISTSSGTREEAAPHDSLASSSASDLQEQSSSEREESQDAPPFSPPPTFIEPEVPDPFLVDDPDDPASDDEDDHGAQKRAEPQPSFSEQSLSSHVDISLSRPSSSPPADRPAHPQAPTTANVNKAVPLPPPIDSDEDEEDAPELYLPGLVIPTMFLPIPNTDALTTLLTKYIYPPDKRPHRDLTGEWQRSDFHTLVMTNSWRALARMARDRIVTTDPSEVALILSLWYIRLASLARLRLFNQTAAECTNLFTVLYAVEPAATRTWLFTRLLPFELEVMHARLKYCAGDHMGYLDALSALLRTCRRRARAAGGVDRAMWQERGARMCLILASQLMEMKDYVAAAGLLEPLCLQQAVFPAALRSAVGRVYLQGGHVARAAEHFAAVAASKEADAVLNDMNAALLASASGDWPAAAERLQALLARDADNFVAVNNLAVALLNQGKLKQSIEVLEAALRTSPSSVVVAEPFLFNLSTLYELRSVTAVERKKNLLIEVAKWSGDGLKATCLKMPSN